MKNLLKGTFFVMLMTIMTPGQSKDLSRTAEKRTVVTLDEEETARLLRRLQEISEMDKDNITRSQKIELRKEVKAIKKTMSSGIYLSVGVIIIILLLIILL